MAKFNPDLPLTQDPNYLGYSHASPKPEADLSLGTLFSGIGDLLNVGLKSAKQLNERGITQQIRERVEPVRDDFIDQMSNTVQKLAQANPQQAAANVAGPLPPQIAGQDTVAPSDSSTDILPYTSEETQPNIAPNIQGALNQMKQIQNARTVKPELRTLYDAKMLSIAREMRAQYPGQVDFIDQKISEITGGNPANKMLTDLMSSIQSYVGAAGQQDKQIESFLLRQVGKVPNADLALQYFKQTGDRQGALRFINNSNITKMKVEEKENNQKLENMDTETAANNSLQNLNLLTTEHAANTMQLATLNLNINGRKLSTGTDIANFVTDVMSGKETVNEKDTLALAQGIASLEQRARKYLWDESTRIRADGKSMQSKIDGKWGPNRTKETIDNNMAQTFGYIRDQITKGRWDLANSSLAVVTGAINDKQKEIVSNPDGIGDAIVLQSALEKLSPNLFQGFYQTMIQNSGITGNLKKFFEYEASKLGVQTDPNNPATIKQSMERAKKLFPDASPNTFSKINGALINTINVLGQKGASDGVKLNAVTSAFDPSMRNFISTISGQEGKNQTFRVMTSPTILKELQRLDAAHPDKNVMGRYQAWMEDSFSSQLFRTNAADVNEALRQPGVKILWTNTPNGSARFDAVPDQDPRRPGSRQGQVSNDYVANVQRKLDSINYNLQSVMEFAKATGKDPEGYLLELMAKSGMDVRKDVMSEGQSLPRAVISSRFQAGRGSNINSNSKVGE